MVGKHTSAVAAARNLEGPLGLVARGYTIRYSTPEADGAEPPVTGGRVRGLGCVATSLCDTIATKNLQKRSYNNANYPQGILTSPAPREDNLAVQLGKYYGPDDGPVHRTSEDLAKYAVSH